MCLIGKVTARQVAAFGTEFCEFTKSFNACSGLFCLYGEYVDGFLVFQIHLL